MSIEDVKSQSVLERIATLDRKVSQLRIAVVMLLLLLGVHMVLG